MLKIDDETKAIVNDMKKRCFYFKNEKCFHKHRKMYWFIKPLCDRSYHTPCMYFKVKARL